MELQARTLPIIKKSMITILIETLVWEYLLTLSFRLCETEKLSKGFLFKKVYSYNLKRLQNYGKHKNYFLWH